MAKSDKMKRNIIDTTASKNNGVADAALSRKGVGRRTPRLNHRSISPYTLQKLLITGIFFALAVGVISLYSRLMKIESNDAGRVLRLGSTTTSQREKPSLSQLLDPRLQKKKSRRIPGRARGSERGRVECDEDISHLVSYWDDPRSDVDRAFQSPFLDPPPAHTTKTKRTRYLSFEPDLGGWNNIRMEFEIMVVLASATGRTLILPPDNPLYLLHKDKGNRHRGLQKFFHGFDDIVDTISTEDFFQKEMLEKKSYPLPTDEKNRTRVMSSLQKCYWMAKSDSSCVFLFEYLSQVADFVPDWQGEHNCLIMDDANWFRDQWGDVDDTRQQQVSTFCAKRKPVYYTKQLHDAPLLHFRSHKKDTRLLVHFYAFIYFTDPKMGNHYKRLVRDRVRYSDEIFCAAGKIVKSLIEKSTGSLSNGAGTDAGYFSMHIRRGDFQWPKMRISAGEWFENTRSWLVPDNSELLYIGKLQFHFM